LASPAPPLRPLPIDGRSQDANLRCGTRLRLHHLHPDRRLGCLVELDLQHLGEGAEHGGAQTMWRQRVEQPADDLAATSAMSRPSTDMSVEGPWVQSQAATMRAWAAAMPANLAGSSTAPTPLGTTARW